MRMIVSGDAHDRFSSSGKGSKKRPAGGRLSNARFCSPVAREDFLTFDFAPCSGKEIEEHLFIVMEI